MEIFRNLNISADPDRMAAIVDLIERSPPAGWTRDRAAEGNARSALVLKPRPVYCFSYTQHGKRPDALVILTRKEAGTFFVSNIVPLSKHQLAHGEYNAILEEFYEHVIRPYTGTHGLTASLSGGEVELEHWMSHHTAELLRQFSDCANRGTGSSHPADRERWNSFVISAHHDGSRMGASDLRRWLIEVDGWAPEVAEHLAAEYDYGRELLAFADAHRRSA